MRVLKNNFERLDSLFQDSLEEVKTVRSECEAKLIEAENKLRVTKAENEELKEKVDVLFKLGRSYINKKEKHPPTETEDKNTDNKSSREDEIETVSVEEITIEEVTEEDLQSWKKKKN